jgi:branched-subunit amino acid ABC-type transport system permease component
VSDLVLLLLNFMSTFSVLVLIAVSLGLIFGQLGIINLAQGDLVMVGAYVMYATRNLPFGVGLAVAVVFGALLGIVLERGVIARLYPRGFVPTLLATWGIGIVLRQLADALFTSTPRTVAAPVGGSITVLGVQYPTYSRRPGGPRVWLRPARWPRAGAVPAAAGAARRSRPSR